jgi:hypothetical protein
MKLLFALPLLIPLAGCQTSFKNLTPAQDAALACLGAQAGSAIAATSMKPNTAAAVAANGQVLCTTATGVASIVGTK